MDDPIKCAVCGAEIEFCLEKCSVCGTFDSYPNVRKARQEEADLTRFYREAESAARLRKVETKTALLEHRARSTKIVVNVEIDVILNMIKDSRTNYVSRGGPTF